MEKIIFATNNQHKVDEIRHYLDKSFEIITLQEAGIHIEIPEPHDTLEENAREKSTTIHEITKLNCFSEDTGLEVEALNGEPGVKSARYAGEKNDPERNMIKLLENLKGIENRKARFRTVISLILHNEEFQFTGICKGEIQLSPSGTHGFGYDPIFVPEGGKKTFAEMDKNEKNRFSHRRKAMDKLLLFLQKIDE
ncbi:MAG: RdgB/HAM1 family non-canonical purine NTP pyrophosphatase [Chitinophagaceae bacterium]